MEALSLKFRLFGIPITIEPTFFLLSLLFFRMAGDVPGTIEVMVWVLIAILVHELGHAFAMRQYGLEPMIRLYLTGGMAYWERNPVPPLSNWKRIWIALAGPAAGFGLGILLWGWSQFAALPHFALSESQVYSYTRFFTIYWSILNLLPVYPLDGGQALYYGLQLNPRWNARLLTGIVTLLVGGTLLVLALLAEAYWMALLLVFILYKNLSMLQGSRDQHLSQQIQLTTQMLYDGNTKQAVPQLHDILSKAKTKPCQQWAMEQLGEYYGQNRQWEAVLDLQSRYPAHEPAIGYSLALALFHLRGRAESLALARKVLDQTYEARLARFYVAQLIEEGKLADITRFLPLSSGHKDYPALQKFTLDTLHTSGQADALDAHPQLRRLLGEA